MATITGAPYLHFEGSYCVEDEGGCGQLLTQDEWAPEFRAEHIDQPWPEVLAMAACPNCGARPLAHVNVTTADQIPGTES